MYKNQFERQPYSTQGFPGQSDFPPARKSRTGMIILIIFGILSVLGIFCCGGFGGLAYYGFSYMVREVRSLVAEVPEVKEHIGEIKSFNSDFTRSFADDDDDTFVYEIEGTKGNGRVHVKHVTDDNGDEVLVSGELVLPGERSIPLTIDPR